MAKKKRLTLGLHTQAEQDDAYGLALEVYEDAKARILEDEDKEALLFAQGFLQAIRALADLEGARELSIRVDRLVGDLSNAYRQVRG